MKSFKHFTNKVSLQETGANTSWKDEKGNELSLADLEKITSHIPVSDIPVSDIAHLGLHNRTGEQMKDRISKITIDRPIYMLGNKILDGNHRLAKAVQDGRTHIQGKRFELKDIHPDHHEKFKSLFGD